MAVVDELVTLIGYKLDERGAATLKAAKTEIVDMAKKVAALSITVIAGKTAFQGWFSNILENSMQLQKLSDDTNISAEALQTWGYAAGRMGGDAKGALTNIQAFQRGLHGAMPWQINEPLAMQLPEYLQNPNMAVNEVLNLLSAKYSALAKQGPEGKLKAFRLGNAGGLNDDNTRLLMQGAEGLQKLKKMYEDLGGGVGTDKQVDENAKLWQSFFDLKTAAEGYSSHLLSKLSPSITHVINDIKNWIIKNKELHDQQIAFAEQKTSEILGIAPTSKKKPEDEKEPEDEKLSGDWGKSFNTAIEDAQDNLDEFYDYLKTSTENIKGVLVNIKNIFVDLGKSVWDAFDSIGGQVFEQAIENLGETELAFLKVGKAVVWVIDEIAKLSGLDLKFPSAYTLPQLVTLPEPSNNHQSTTTNYNQIDMRIDGTKHPVETGKAVAGAISAYFMNPSLVN